MIRLTGKSQSPCARWVVERGMGVLVPAAALTDQHVGLGLYQDDEDANFYRWVHIVGVTRGSEGQVNIQFVHHNTTRSESTEGDSKTEIFQVYMFEYAVTFDPGEDLLISTKPVPRPERWRTTVVTTRVEIEE